VPARANFPAFQDHDERFAEQEKQCGIAQRARSIEEERGREVEARVGSDRLAQRHARCPVDAAALRDAGCRERPEPQVHERSEREPPQDAESDESEAAWPPSPAREPAGSESHPSGCQHLKGKPGADATCQCCRDEQGEGTHEKAEPRTEDITAEHDQEKDRTGSDQARDEPKEAIDSDQYCQHSDRPGWICQDPLVIGEPGHEHDERDEGQRGKEQRYLDASCRTRIVAGCREQKRIEKCEQPADTGEQQAYRARHSAKPRHAGASGVPVRTGTARRCTSLLQRSGCKMAARISTPRTTRGPGRLK